MKKVLLAFGVGALLLSTASCGKSSVSDADKAANDSISDLFGVVVGNQFAQEINHMPEINKEAFLRGVSTAVLADTSDMSFQQGLAQGSRLAQQFQYFYKEMGVSIDRDMFLKQFKKAILSDSVVSDLMVQQAMLNQMIEQAQKRAAERKEAELNNAPDAVANRKAGEAYIDSLRKADPSVQVTPSGLAYKVVARGEGDAIKDEDMASVIYKGSLADGTVFDDSKGEARQFSPRRVVPGFGEGLKMMNKGAKYVLYIPGDLAYGVNGMPQAGIGPNQMLIFDVEIADINTNKK